MKKLLPIVILVVLAAVAWFFSSQRQSSTGSSTMASQANSSASAAAGETSVTANGDPAPKSSSQDGEDADGTVDVDVQPASRAYKNADEALNAVKKGASDYDDTILEQFTQPGDDCTWCGDFYKGLRDMLTAPGTTPDQMSYYSELLAISGRIENVQALVDGIKSPASEEQAEAYAEALELTVGKDNVVQYLSDQLSSSDERLREASVAAITNQGSRLSAEILYKHTVEHGDPDGYYSLGIGLGEFVPDEDSMPYLQEVMDKHDQYSHLAVKALLNSGLDGLKLVFDSVGTVSDPDVARQMLKDAADHVNYEEDIQTYLQQQVDTQKNPALKEFAQKSLDAMKEAESNDATDGTAADEPEEEPVQSTGQ